MRKNGSPVIIKTSILRENVRLNDERKKQDSIVHKLYFHPCTEIMVQDKTTQDKTSLDKTSQDKMSQDKMSQDIRFPGTKRPKGQNVPRTTRSKGQNVLHVNSYKSSLTIICMCLKMCCHIYMLLILILFLFMWTRCGYLMFHPAPPPCLS